MLLHRGLSMFKKGGNSLPKANLLFSTKGVVDSIGLSASDYDLVGATWQPVFFTNPTTPIVFPTFADLWAAVSAVNNFNMGNVLGSESKGIAVYNTSTSRATLNKALRWFGLPEVSPTIEDRYTNTDHYDNLENYA